MKIMVKPKILLIHGWDYVNYTSSGCIDAWSNRSKFAQALSRHFDVVRINLPGFCGQSDPGKPWNLDDYVDYVNIFIEKEHPDYILGYSFGGAIVLHWKRRSRDVRVKTFLVSPAIIRKYEKTDLGFVKKTLKSVLSKELVSLLRDFYLTKVVKNPYYSKATKVMRETYRNIVAVDLREDLLQLTDSLTLIYGENDTATPPNLVQEVLRHSKIQHRIEIISSGGHNIANSHTEELVSLIVKKREVTDEV